MNNPITDYQSYLDDFDPSPIGYGDDYGMPLDYDSWLAEQLDSIGLY